jgi:hypothetical protein
MLNGFDKANSMQAVVQRIKSSYLNGAEDGDETAQSQETTNPQEWTFRIERLLSTEYPAEHTETKEGEKGVGTAAGAAASIAAGASASAVCADNDSSIDHVSESITCDEKPPCKAEEEADAAAIAAVCPHGTATSCCAVDDRLVLDLIHNVDQFLTVGQFWKFDDAIAVGGK